MNCNDCSSDQSHCCTNSRYYNDNYSPCKSTTKLGKQEKNNSKHSIKYTLLTSWIPIPRYRIKEIGVRIPHETARIQGPSLRRRQASFQKRRSFVKTSPASTSVYRPPAIGQDIGRLVSCPSHCHLGPSITIIVQCIRNCLRHGLSCGSLEARIVSGYIPTDCLVLRPGILSVETIILGPHKASVEKEAGPVDGIALRQDSTGFGIAQYTVD